MLEGADRDKPSPVALLPIALIAAIVVVVALVVAGNQTGTIVVERVVLSSTSTEGSKTQHQSSSFTNVTETAADGSPVRYFSANSISRPGFQRVSSAQELELYDPLDNTVVETTQSAWSRLVDAQAGQRAGASGKSATVYSRLVFSAGRHSILAQQLLAHQARLAGRTTIDGRPALRLVPVHQSLPGDDSDRFVTSSVDYVAPGSYDPIEEISSSKLSNVRELIVARWRSYRVLAATPRHQWLLSLTARHPGARVVHGASAYLRATQNELRTVTIQTGQTLANAAG